MQEIINIDNQKCMSIRGVEKIVSSTPTQSVVQTSLSKIVIIGNNLEVKKLDIENKDAIIEGEILSIKFNKKGEKKNLLRRIFK